MFAPCQKVITFAPVAAPEHTSQKLRDNDVLTRTRCEAASGKTPSLDAIGINVIVRLPHPPAGY